MRQKGQVWWLTTILTFPKDKDEWTKQEPFTGDRARWIHKHLQNFSEVARAKLIRGEELATKDHNGVWMRLRILPNRIPTKWGTKPPKL